MLTRRHLVSLSLAALSLFALFTTSTLHAGTTGVSVSNDGLGLLHGGAMGAWNLPVPGNPSMAGGVLIVPGTGPVFALEAGLVAVPTPNSPLRAGHMVGRLLKLTPDGAPGDEFARVRGHWIAEPSGKGHFEAFIVQPDPSDDTPGVVIGRMRGRFFDPPQNPSPNGAGEFRAHWVIRS